MNVGKLVFEPVERYPDLVAEPTKQLITENKLADILVSAINPELADTAAFCEYYDVGLDISANCVIVKAKTADSSWYAACMILATDRIDVNGIVRRQLAARKISFAPMDEAVSLTKMEYGGITPIGLPADWPILVDARVAQTSRAIIGSGIRSSKLLASGATLAALPQATVLDIVKPN